MQFDAMVLSSIVKDVNECSDIINDNKNTSIVRARNEELLRQAITSIIENQFLF